MYDYLICVATINGPERLENFVKSIVEHTDPALNYKISIVDDCSLPELTQRNYFDVAVKYNCFYKRNEKRSGVAHSWNSACSLADSKNIVIANDDILVTPYWLKAYNEWIKINSEKQIGVVGWKHTNSFEEYTEKIPSSSFKVMCDLDHLEEPVVSPSGCLFAFSRELYNEVNGFDEQYFASYEEVDFGAKSSMLGYKNINIDNPIIYHQNSASFSDPINQIDPVFKEAEFSEERFINKWIDILKIKRGKKRPSTLIKEISKQLIEKQSLYSESDYKSILIG